MGVQDQYWKELYQLRVHVNYLELYHQRSESQDKTVKIILAVASSSSIAAWAVWQKYSFIWALVIALSQVITAIKGFLPYETRLKLLTSLLSELEELLNFTETNWYYVSNGSLTEREIHELQFETRRKKTKAIHEHLGSNSLPEKPKFHKKAVESANVYINNFYPSEV